MTPDDLKKHGLRVKEIGYSPKWYVAHANYICAALEPIAPPDVAQAARVLLDHYDNLDCVEAVSRDFIDTLHGAIMLHGAIAGETP